MHRDPADLIKRRESQALKLALIVFMFVLPFVCFQLKHLQEELEMKRPFDAKRWKELLRSYKATNQNGIEIRHLAEKVVYHKSLIGKSYEEVVNLLDLDPKALDKKTILESGNTVTLPRDEALLAFDLGTWLEVDFDKRGRVKQAQITYD
jgi:hypothetical protein